MFCLTGFPPPLFFVCFTPQLADIERWVEEVNHKQSIDWLAEILNSRRVWDDEFVERVFEWCNDNIRCKCEVCSGFEDLWRHA